MAIKVVQRDLLKLIKIAVSEHPIDLSKFLVKVLEKILPEVKDQLGIDFDDVKVYPGPQPRESADIELFKDGNLIMRINEKTCMSGDLRVTIRRLKRSLRYKEEGLVIAFVLFEKEDKADLRMLIVLIPQEVIRKVRTEDIDEYIREFLLEKTFKEGYQDYHLIAFNEAVNLLRAYQTIVAAEKADAALKAVDEVKSAVHLAIKKAGAALKAVDEVKSAVSEIRKEVRQLSNRVSNIEESLDNMKDELKGYVEKLFEKHFKKLIKIVSEGKEND